ncbi:MAG: oligopeptidase B, partial [Terriglobales bacterium]
MVHGDERVDNYYWMREKSGPEVHAYLEAENAYVDAVMEPTRGFQEKLYGEMLARIQETDLSVPYRKDGYFYYSRTEKGKQYPIHCRKKGSLKSDEEVLLDLNEMAKGEKFLALGALEVSDDGNWLAYSVDNTGFRQYELRVKNLKTGKPGPEHIAKTVSLAWAADNQTLFYSTEDAAKRPYRVYRHRLGSAEDALVYEERDEMFNVDLERTRSRQYLFLTTASLTTSEVRYLAAKRPAEEWKLVEARQPGQEYYLEHRGDHFYVRSNRAGRNFALFAAPVAEPDAKHWQEVVAHRDQVMLEEMTFFQNYSVLREREDGLVRLRVTDLRNGQSHRIEFPEPAYSAGFDENREFDTSVLRYN